MANARGVLDVYEMTGVQNQHRGILSTSNVLDISEMTVIQNNSADIRIVYQIKHSTVRVFFLCIETAVVHYDIQSALAKIEEEKCEAWFCV